MDHIFDNLRQQRAGQLRKLQKAVRQVAKAGRNLKSNAEIPREFLEKELELTYSGATSSGELRPSAAALPL